MTTTTAQKNYVLEEWNNVESKLKQNAPAIKLKTLDVGKSLSTNDKASEWNSVKNHSPIWK